MQRLHFYVVTSWRSNVCKLFSSTIRYLSRTLLYRIVNDINIKTWIIHKSYNSIVSFYRKNSKLCITQPTLQVAARCYTRQSEEQSGKCVATGFAETIFTLVRSNFNNSNTRNWSAYFWQPKRATACRINVLSSPLSVSARWKNRSHALLALQKK